MDLGGGALETRARTPVSAIPLQRLYRTTTTNIKCAASRATKKINKKILHIIVRIIIQPAVAPGSPRGQREAFM